MTSSGIFGLYPTFNSYNTTNFVSFDEDNSCSLASYRPLVSDHTPHGYYVPNIIIHKPFDEDGSPAIPLTELVDGPSGPLAVEVRDVVYNYGKGKKIVGGLRGINLSVPQGGIYGLLGPSGCGKTTLLRCLVGRLQPHGGKLDVCGQIPGAAGSLIPGPVVGYMPQEIALFPDFTIEETLTYFGRLYRMKERIMQQRIHTLIPLLELPEKTRLIGNLSGGQQRRVSLAVALLHSPPLVILDEPTVGVDPVLRQTIWNHLVNLTKTGSLTVIITTHYIEEARAANIVGLMRYGRILVESSPEDLLKRFGLLTLEAVFLKLCQIDSGHEANLPVVDLEAIDNKPDICTVTPQTNRTNSRGSSLKNDALSDEINISKFNASTSLLLSSTRGKSFETPSGSSTFKEYSPTSHMKKFQNDSGLRNSVAKTSALFQKNVTRLRRNLPVLLFQFLLPSIEVILFCVCIGRDPIDIGVAIYNEENPPSLTSWFLRSIDNNTVVQVHHNSLESALNSVEHGHAWAAIHFGHNFSSALELRIMMGGTADNITIEASKMKLYLDMTNQVIAYKLQRTFTEGFLKFAKEALVSFGQNPSSIDLPVDIELPIYGDKQPSFTEFMAPGVLLSITFLAAVALTALAFVMERKEGLLERSLVAGVSSYEFLMSHVLTQLLVLTVQVCLLLIFTFIVFEIPSRGPFIWVILLTLLQGSCGMSFGLMISSLCEEENSATMLALGSFYPNLLLSGTVWPTQAMPVFMKYLSYTLPQTIPIESMRYILSRGWGPSYPEVAIGFAITIGWTLTFLILAVIIFKLKK